MKKRFFKQMTTGMLVMALVCSLLSAFTISQKKANAAETGTWVLQSYKIEKGLEEYLGNTHVLTNKYDLANNVTIHSRTTTFSNADGTFSASWESSCQMPPVRIPGDTKVTLLIKTSVSGNTMDGLIYSNSCSVKEGHGTAYFYKDGTYQSGSVNAKTGPDYVAADQMLVWREIDPGSDSYNSMDIVFDTSLGRGEDGWMTTTWTYKWVPDVIPSETASPSSSNTDAGSVIPKGVVAKIANIKGAKAKVIVKKVSGATKYRIRYKVGKSKKWSKVKTSKKGNFKIKVKKGKKLNVQASVVTSAGTGAWGKVKKFKTDKK